MVWVVIKENKEEKSAFGIDEKPSKQIKNWEEKSISYSIKNLLT